LGAWLRRWFSHDLTHWLPAGDMGVFLEKRLARVQFHLPSEAGSHTAHGPGHDEPAVEDASPWSARLVSAGGHLARIETRLRSWPVAGGLLLLLMGLILWLLTGQAN